MRMIRIRSRPGIIKKAYKKLTSELTIPLILFYSKAIGQADLRCPDHNNVLIIDFSNIGDFLRITPVIRELKLNNPNVLVFLLTVRSNEPLIRRNTNLTGAFFFEDKFINMFDILRFTKELKEKDLVFKACLCYCVNEEHVAASRIICRLLGVGDTYFANELSKTVTFYNSSHPENPLSPQTPLLLTGELSSDATTKLIQSQICQSVRSSL